MKTEIKTYPGDNDNDGNPRQYKVTESGTWYNHKTDDKVIENLEKARELHYPVRLFLGDSETGRDWNEENYTRGTIGRSMGPVKIPLLIVKRTDNGGGGILTHCIVKLKINGLTVYQHPLYNCNQFKVVPTSETNDRADAEKYPWSVLRCEGDGWTSYALFKKVEKAAKYIAFMRGEVDSLT